MLDQSKTTQGVHDDLQSLEPKARFELLAHARLREHRRGTHLETREEPAADTALHIVSSGLVALMAHDPDPRPLALYHSGQVISPIREGERWTLTALAASHVHHLSADHMEELEGTKWFQRWRAEVSEAALRRSLALAAASGKPDASARILSLVRAIGLPGGVEGEFGWPFTQAQLAALAGMSRAHLNAQLAALRRDGRLSIKDGVASIRP